MTSTEIVDAGQAKTEEKAIAKAPPPNVMLENGSFQPNDMNGLWRMAEMYHASGFTPDGVNSPQSCFIIMAKALEIGLGLMQSMESIAVINGKAAIWGDAITALIHRSGLLEEWEETYEGDAGTDEWACVCRMKRKGGMEVANRFSLADAKQAGLMSKTPWQRYTARMMKMRARGFTSRDLFADVLGGMYLAEELIGGDSFDPGKMRVAVNNESQDDSKSQLDRLQGRLEDRTEETQQPAEDEKQDGAPLAEQDGGGHDAEPETDAVEEEVEDELPFKPTDEDLEDAGLRK